MASVNLFTPEKLSGYELQIREAYQNASPALRHDGIRWYMDAQQSIRDIVENHPEVSIAQGCAMVARLSPQCGWERNLYDFKNVLQFGNAASVTSYKRNQRIATKIRDIGEERLLAELSTYFPKSGPKIWSFFNNLYQPELRKHVTIDRHILRFLFGNEYRTQKDATGSVTNRITPRQYQLLEQCFVNVASALGIAPHELQATVWLLKRKS